MMRGPFHTISYDGDVEYRATSVVRGYSRENPGRRPKDRATSQILRQPASSDVPSRREGFGPDADKTACTFSRPEHDVKRLRFALSFSRYVNGEVTSVAKDMSSNVPFRSSGVWRAERCLGGYCRCFRWFEQMRKMKYCDLVEKLRRVAHRWVLLHVVMYPRWYGWYAFCDAEWKSVQQPMLHCWI